MKNYAKLIVSVIILCFFGLSSNAQSLRFSAGTTISKTNVYDDGVRMFFFGENGYSGQNFGNSYENKYSWNDPYKIGWNARISFNWLLNDNLSLETGLLVCTKTFYYEGEGYEMDAYGSDKYEFEEFNSIQEKYLYLDIPVVFNFNLFRKENFNVYGKGGLFFGFALKGNYLSEYSSKETMNIGGTITEDNYSEIEEGEINLDGKNNLFLEDIDWRFNTGVQAGAGLSYKNFFLEGTYNLAIANLKVEDDLLYLRNDIIVAFGYQFNFKKMEKEEKPAEK